MHCPALPLKAVAPACLYQRHGRRELHGTQLWRHACHWPWPAFHNKSYLPQRIERTAHARVLLHAD